MKNKNNKKEPIEIKDINDDFSNEVKNRKRIIILVEHSKSYAKEYAFKTYINKRFNSRGEKYVITIAHLDYLNVDELNPSEVAEKLKADLNKVYDEFKAKYPGALLEKPISFNYALNYSSKSNMGEIMTVVLMRISDEFCKIQISPIVKISKKQYDMILGKDKSDEGKLVREIFTEKRFGIEQYGLIGYLTDGKFKTHNMYMEGLLDLINESRSNEEFRPNVLEYKNYRASKNAYLFSIKTDEEKKSIIDEENEPVV